MKITSDALLGQKNGATLVEVIGAVLVFMIGVAALLGIFAQSAQVGERAQTAYTAYNLAKNRIETLKAMDFGNLTSAAETDTRINEKGDADPDGAFTRSTAVTANYSGKSTLTQVQVSVDYTVQGKAGQAPMEVTTVIFDEENGD